ncbi:MAG: hypothetical protein NT117_08860 [Gammaproteobacteria bacterium]|nr:hypothetical protein [Gammaproteobacteria bacterium]
MSSIPQQVSESASLFRAFDSIRNWRAGLLLFGSFLAMAVIIAVFSYFSVKLAVSDLPTIARGVGVLGLVLGVVALLIGFSATGILLMDQSKGLARRSTGNALFSALVTLPRLLGLLLLELLLILALMLVAALLLLLCKIPVLGPALYTVVFPACVLAFGFTWFALGFVVNPLAYPALWEGSTISQAVFKLWHVVRHDAFAVVTRLLILWAMVTLAMLVLYGVVALGTMATGAMSMAILELNPGSPESAQYLLGSLMAGNLNFNGYASAAIIGLLLLAGLVVVLPTLIYTQGVCLIYLQRARDVDTSEAEAKMQARMQGLREQAQAAQEQLRQGSAPVMPAQIAPRHCHSCGGPIVAGAGFCESCGSRVS